jgi:hypothetical protein
MCTYFFSALCAHRLYYAEVMPDINEVKSRFPGDA